MKPQLRMLRTPLEDLPEVELPEPYRTRSYQPGDSEHWTRILAASFGGELEKYPFDSMMRKDHAFRPERVLFVTCNEVPVATASAYPKPGFMPGTSTLHYVAVLPEHQGYRLGYWVGLAALHQMVAEGFTGAWLATDDFRMAAIKTYLNLGFAPLLIDENQRARWADVFREFGRPELCEYFRQPLEGPLWVSRAQHDDAFDYAGGVVRRRRHHVGRPVGRPSRGECDACADESLYRASELGAAGASVSSVLADEDKPFELWFRVGPAGLACGTVVQFYTPGQKPLGTPLQVGAAEQPGFVEVASPQDGRVVAVSAGFRVASGRLLPGEEVRLTVGREHGFRWTPLAGPKELKVVLDVGHGEPLLRLPEPVVVRVLPGAPDHLDVFLPGSAACGQQGRAVVSLRDRFDNRVPRDTSVRVSDGENELVTAALQTGLASVPLPAMSTGVRQVTARCAELEGAFASNCCLPAADMNLYFGDLHVHDLTCPAEGYPVDVYRWAIEEKRLDFISVAVQNHAHLDNEKWVLNKHMAEAFLDEGRFVTFPAFEWQHSHYGDKVVHYLSGDRPYLPVDDARYDRPAKLYDALRGTDALVISHHPGYALDLHVPGTDWDAVETDVERLVELWSMHGSSEGADAADRPLVGPRREEGVMAALRNGLRLGFVAGSDTHSARPGGSAKEPRPYWGGLCAVWAEQLTRRSLFEALRARRTYALTGARIALQFTVNGARMGSELPAAVRCELVGEVWAPEGIAEIRFLRNGATVYSEKPGARQARVEWVDDAPEPAFYHCRVTQTDGHLAVCSPVWVG